MSRILLIIFSCFLSFCFETAMKKDTIQLGRQIWMKNNLSVVTFRNGDTILEAKTNEEWDQARTAAKPAWCFFKFENEGMGFWWSATGNESHDVQYAWVRVVGKQSDSLHH